MYTRPHGCLDITCQTQKDFPTSALKIRVHGTSAFNELAGKLSYVQNIKLLKHDRSSVLIIDLS